MRFYTVVYRFNASIVMFLKSKISTLVVAGIVK